MFFIRLAVFLPVVLKEHIDKVEAAAPFRFPCEQAYGRMFELFALYLNRKWYNIHNNKPAFDFFRIRINAA